MREVHGEDRSANFFSRIKPEQPGLTRMNVNAAASLVHQSTKSTNLAPPRSRIWRISRFNFLPPFLLSSHIAQFYHPSKKSVGSPSRNRKTPLQLSHYQPLANTKKSRTPSKPGPKLAKSPSTLKNLISWTPQMEGRVIREHPTVRTSPSLAPPTRSVLDCVQPPGAFRQPPPNQTTRIPPEGETRRAPSDVGRRMLNVSPALTARKSNIANRKSSAPVPKPQPEGSPAL